MNNTKVGAEETTLLPQVDEIQSVNELVANIPKELKIAGKVIRVDSKTPTQLIVLERVRQGLERARQEKEMYTMEVEKSKQAILTQISAEGTASDRLEELWLAFEKVQAESTSDEAVQNQLELAEKVMAQVTEVLYHIINADPEKPRLDRVWINQHISMEDATKILDMYEEKNSLTSFFSRTQDLRMF